MTRATAFEHGIVAARPQLRSFALSLCRNPDMADDLVQDTMLLALSKEHLFEVGTNLNAWLFTILRNKFYSDRKKRRREVEDPDETIAKGVPLEDSPLKKMEVREILRLVEEMPPNWRLSMALIADGATYEEAAAELTLQVGTIKSRVSRGRALLKAAE